MTHEDYCKTVDFIKVRFLNNLAARIKHDCQEFNDVLEILAEDHPDLTICDSWTIVERQNRIVRLEADNLWSAVRHLTDRIETKVKNADHHKST